jgi:hypothetical protein
MHHDDPPRIDALQFVALTRGLRDAFGQVAEADLTASQRARWQRRLGTITDVARHDLPAAAEQLARFERDWHVATR